MTLYMNQIYFGHGRYGVAGGGAVLLRQGRRAARRRRGRDARGPAAVAETTSRRGSRTRRARRSARPTCSTSSSSIGKLTQAEAQKWIDAPIKIVKNPFPELGSAPEWVELAKRELIAENGEAALDTLGATVAHDARSEPPGRRAAARCRPACAPSTSARASGARCATLKADKIDARRLRRSRRSCRPGGPKAEGDLRRRGHRRVRRRTRGRRRSRRLASGRSCSGAAATRGSTRPTRTGRSRSRASGSSRATSSRSRCARRRRAEDGRRGRRRPSAKAPIGRSTRSTTSGSRRRPEGAVVIIEVEDPQGPRAGRRLRVEGRRVQPRDDGEAPAGQLVQAVRLRDRRSTSGKYTAGDAGSTTRPRCSTCGSRRTTRPASSRGPVLLRHALAKSINTVAIRVTYDMKPETRRGDRAADGHRERAAERDVARARLGRGHAARDDERTRDARRRRASRRRRSFVDAIDGKPSPPSQGRAGAAARGRVRRHRHDASVVTEGTGHARRGAQDPDRGQDRNLERRRATPGSSASRPDYAIGVWIGNDDNRAAGRHETGGTTAAPGVRRDR